MKKAITLFVLSLLPTVTLIQIDYANARNIGDPIKLGCGKNATTLTSRSQKVTYQGKTVTLSLEMRASRQCQARWVRAFVPKDTQLYFKDKRGNKYVNYTAQVHGQNYTDAENSMVLLQACAKHPRASQEWCTEFY